MNLTRQFSNAIERYDRKVGWNESAHPRDGLGRWTASGLHAVSLPPNPRKLTISQAANALAAIGHRLGKPKHDLRTGQTTYDVIHNDGTAETLTSQQIRDIVYHSQARKKPRKVKPSFGKLRVDQQVIQSAEARARAAQRYEREKAVSMLQAAIERYAFNESQVKRDTQGRFATKAMASSPKWFQKAYPAVKKSLAKALEQGDHSAAMTREELADAFDAAGHGTSKQAIPFLRQMENDGTLRKFKVAGETRYALADREVAPDEADSSEETEPTLTHPFESTQGRKPAGEVNERHKAMAASVLQSLDREMPLGDVLDEVKQFDESGKPANEVENDATLAIADMIQKKLIEYQKRPGVKGSFLRRTDLEPREDSDWEAHTGKYARMFQASIDRYSMSVPKPKENPRKLSRSQRRKQYRNRIKSGIPRK